MSAERRQFITLKARTRVARGRREARHPWVKFPENSEPALAGDREIAPCLPPAPRARCLVGRVPRVPLRSTRGFMLPPAPQARILLLTEVLIGSIIRL